ncbi:MAG: pyridoxamine 5'-phosphate oxidase family protein [Dehalococcoidia bacterium]|nr:pyridoxamine 5'-phosphate oxidase family protein [Dehalococcoidia bacterium]
MVSWKEFAAAEPELAGIGEQRLDEKGVLLVGTIRKDGTPRISPVEPVFSRGELYLGMMWRSKKALDLLRDPRVLVHSIVLDKDATGGDFKVRGRAVEVTDDAERAQYSQDLLAKIGWAPEESEEPYHLFKVDVEDVAFLTFGKEGMSLRQWRAE